MYTLVFHPCYYSNTDNGCRVYKSDDQYLMDHPSMYTEIARFNTLEAANAAMEEEPVMSL